MENRQKQHKGLGPKCQIQNLKQETTKKKKKKKRESQKPSYNQDTTVFKSSFVIGGRPSTYSRLRRQWWTYIKDSCANDEIGLKTLVPFLCERLSSEGTDTTI
ncbi:hypothetical protein RDI58_013376 [Solanum bulbocastanum]|uniref:Uncharacterized protein n=1 Tax=Solanum bulbocastanum TaxID=147425 RepID=A0AAN8TTH5_SOLBU